MKVEAELVRETIEEYVVGMGFVDQRRGAEVIANQIMNLLYEKAYQAGLVSADPCPGR